MSSWLANQLMRLQQDGRQAMALQEPRYNPRPPGVIQAGSASHAVVEYLTKFSTTQRYFTAGELMRVTNRTHAAVSWALIYLCAQGIVESKPLDVPQVSSRYKKYRLSKDSIKP